LLHPNKKQDVEEWTNSCNKPSRHENL